MKLADLSSGLVYVDTNVLYMYLRSDPSHVSRIRSFLDHVVVGDIEASVGVLVLDELFYRLLLAQISETAGGHPLDVLRRDLPGTLARHGDVVENSIRQLVTLPHLNVVGLEASDGERMFDNVRTFRLLPRDALHVAVMQRLKISTIASDDTDFDRVAGLGRAWLINPPSSENSETGTDV